MPVLQVPEILDELTSVVFCADGNQAYVFGYQGHIDLIFRQRRQYDVTTAAEEGIVLISADDKRLKNATCPKVWIQQRILILFQLITQLGN